MTVNQETGEFLTPTEIREIVAYIQISRASNAPFDLAVNVEAYADQARRTERAQQYSEAGATWWIELQTSGESFEGYRERIRKGPPGK